MRSRWRAEPTGAPLDLPAIEVGKRAEEAVDALDAPVIGHGGDIVRGAERAAIRSESRLDVFVGACLAWIDISTEPVVATILFGEGPRARRTISALISGLVD